MDELNADLFLEAIESGDVDTVKRCLDEGIELFGGTPPLSQAAARGQLEVVRVLFDHEPSWIHTTWSQGYTPLRRAVWFGHEDVVRFLLEHGADQRQDDSGNSPLNICSFRGHSEMVRMLMMYGADHRPDSKGRTPLHEACRRQHYHATLLLLQEGADPCVRDDVSPLSKLFLTHLRITIPQWTTTTTLRLE